MQNSSWDQVSKHNSFVYRFVIHHHCILAHHPASYIEGEVRKNATMRSGACSCGRASESLCAILKSW